MRGLLIFVFILPILVFHFGCAPQRVEETNLPKKKYWITVDNSNFAKEVLNFQGEVLVLFYNDKFWQSRNMEKRFEHFAKQFSNEAKFCKFPWSMDADSKRYNLELLPTTILFENGNELDRIKGIPPNEKQRADWNKDIELWLLQHVADIKPDNYSAEYTYRFNNSYDLNVSNY